MINEVQDISIHEYHYDLPEHRIAKFPVTPRHSSKLLEYRGGHINEDAFINLHKHLPEGAMLVFNDTKVIHARLIFSRQTGAQIEVFCLEPANHADYAVVFASNKEVSWNCLVGNAKRWKDDVLEKVVRINGEQVVFKAAKTAKEGETFVVTFSWNNPSYSFGEVLAYAGSLPIPPYLNRDTEESDEVQYQTVYAQEPGSVAAPTAGLHFTDEVFQSLNDKNIFTNFVTLHVGAGTFKPVKSDTLAGHAMHEERFHLSKASLLAIVEQLEKGKPVVAVGTTSLRILESLYWFGLRWIQQPELKPGLVGQWDAYQTNTTPTTLEVLYFLIQQMNQYGLEELSGDTAIMIAPGFQIRLADAIITNFHQPQSTLLLLIAAMIGEDWKKVYAYAMQHEFRFLSYGDSSLLWRKISG